MIRCKVLGPVEITVAGEAAPPELLWRKNLALLIYLARSPKRVRSRDHLIGLLWGDKQESAARHSLNEALRVLRKSVGEAELASEGDRVRLGEGAVDLDADRLDGLAAAERWEEASELIAGEFMEGFHVSGCSEFEDWLYRERVAWRSVCTDVLIKRSEELLAAGDAGEAAATAQRALLIDSAHEAAARAAILSLAVAGDRAGALNLYQTLANHLEEEVGIEPGEETRALAERIRRERSWHLPAAASASKGGESRRSPLVGRERELAGIVGYLQICMAEPRAGLVVIEGDPGSGKSRLLEEAVARQRLAGVHITELRAVEADRNVPCSGMHGLAEGGLANPGGGPDAGSPRGFAECLRATIERGPLSLVVDDAHWLDHETLLALEAALRDLSGEPFSVLLTITRHAGRQEVDELRARIGREISGTVVSLAPLNAAKIQQLASWALPDFGRMEIERVARRVFTDSAGLPLLAVELLHAIALGLDLRTSPGAWPAPMHTLDQTLPGELPDAIRAAVRLGFRRLSQDAQDVLATAAVLGERVHPDILAEVTGLGADALATALDELEWTRWLNADSRGYSFVARLLGQIISEDMVTSGARRRILDAAKASAN